MTLILSRYAEFTKQIKMHPEEQNQKQAENSEEIAVNSASRLNTIFKFVNVHCPECNSTQIRVDFVAVLLAIASLVAILLLQNIFIRVPYNRFIIIENYLWVLILCAACVIVWVRLFRNSLCKNCGHRFPTELGIQQGKNRFPFPYKFSVLTCLIFLLGYMTSPKMIEMLVHERFITYLLYPFFAFLFFIPVWIFIIASSILYQGIVYGLYQSIVYYLLKKTIYNQYIWGMLFVVPAVFVVGDFQYRFHSGVRTEAILYYGDLADLPNSASDIKVYSWSHFFSGDRYLRFAASPEDIEKFINDSPALYQQECVKYSPEKMRVPHPKDNNKWMEYQEAGHQMYTPSSLTPQWYKMEIRDHARGYSLSSSGHGYGGEVIVDDEENVVYVRLCWD